MQTLLLPSFASNYIRHICGLLRTLPTTMVRSSPPFLHAVGEKRRSIESCERLEQQNRNHPKPWRPRVDQTFMNVSSPVRGFLLIHVRKYSIKKNHDVRDGEDENPNPRRNMAICVSRKRRHNSKATLNKDMAWTPSPPLNDPKYRAGIL